MKITGELLKSERIKLKLSQQDIASALKLSPRTIQSIEEGQIDALPAKTFVRGFVKSYAEMLKLDPQLVLRQFQEEMGTTQPISRVIAVPSENAKVKTYSLEENVTKRAQIATVTPNLKANFNSNTIKLVAVIAFAVIVVGSINQLINKYQKEGLVNPTETQKISVETLNQEQNVPNTAAAVATTPVVTDSISTPVPAAPVVNPTAPVNPAAIAIIPNNKPVELVIEATRDTVISYSVGLENNFRSIELKKNTFQIIKSKSGLQLKVPEGNSILITVNGINKGLAAADSKPIQLTY
jgi:cytoskeleton protein RodZ